MNSLIPVSTVTVNGRAVGFSTNKAGTGLVLMNKKAMGASLGLKGAELKRAHFAYRIEAGKAINGGISALMAEGKLLGASVIPTKSGLRVNFADVSKMEAPAEARSSQSSEVDKAKREDRAKMRAALVDAGIPANQIEAALAKL